jgi:hypothetical protein
MKTVDSGLGTLEYARNGAPSRRPIRSYHDIEAFQRAVTFLRPVHRLALTLSDYEKFDLRRSLDGPANPYPQTWLKATGNGVPSSSFERT